MMKLKIAHMYPDVLNLYGDQGNIETFAKRLEWRNIGCEVVKFPIGSGRDFDDIDIFFIGGGQDFEQGILLEDLDNDKCAAIREQVEKDKSFLCICGGYQIMGKYYQSASGEKWDYIGACDFHTDSGEGRLIGNYAYRLTIDDTPGYEISDDNQKIITGFENHGGRTRLGKGVKPLGTVLAGHGNNGEDGTEGARYRNFFGTYSHGPVLPKNPYFADIILLSALKRKYNVTELEPLDDELEKLAHKEALRIIGVENE